MATFLLPGAYVHAENMHQSQLLEIERDLCEAFVTGHSPLISPNRFSAEERPSAESLVELIQQVAHIQEGTDGSMLAQKEQIIKIQEVSLLFAKRLPGQNCIPPEPVVKTYLRTAATSRAPADIAAASRFLARKARIAPLMNADMFGTAHTLAELPTKPLGQPTMPPATQAGESSKILKKSNHSRGSSTAELSIDYRPQQKIGQALPKTTPIGAPSISDAAEAIISNYNDDPQKAWSIAAQARGGTDEHPATWEEQLRARDEIQQLVGGLIDPRTDSSIDYRLRDIEHYLWSFARASLAKGPLQKIFLGGVLHVTVVVYTTSKWAGISDDPKQSEPSWSEMGYGLSGIWSGLFWKDPRPPRDTQIFSSSFL